MTEPRSPQSYQSKNKGKTDRQFTLPRLPKKYQATRKRQSNQNTFKNGLGQKVEDGQAFGFTAKDRRNHMHILGGTGSGKSKFMELLLRQDILRGDCGLCLLDPHGSLYAETVEFLAHKAPHLADRVILFDPNDQEYEQLGFNPLQNLHEGNQETAAAELMLDALLKSLGQGRVNDTPRIQRWGEDVFHILIRNQLTLLEAEAFIDPEAKKERGVLIEKVTNSIVRTDAKTFEKMSQPKKADIIEGFTNRIRNLISDPNLRSILGRTKATIDFDQILAEKKIVLVNLSSPQERISPRSLDLLGMMVIQSIIRSAKRRQPNHKKDAPFYLYVDEFSRLVTPTVAEGLAETRKYGLFFNLAHQDLTQLEQKDETLAGLIQGNTPIKVVFGRLHVQDAEFMARQMATGYLDLKTVKHISYNWAFWPTEETRVVKSKASSKGRSELSSESQGKAVGKHWGRADTNAHSTSTGASDGVGSGTGMGQGQVLIPTKDGLVIHTSNNTSSTDNHFSGTSRSSADMKGTIESEGGSETLIETSGGGRGTSESESAGETIVPFYKLEPYQQESQRIFYSVDELIHMMAGQIKNNQAGQAYIIAPESHPEPCRVQIKNVASVRVDREVSPRWLSEFKSNSLAAHQEWFLPAHKAEDMIAERQANLFGYDHPLIEVEAVPVSVETPLDLPEREQTADNVDIEYDVQPGALGKKLKNFPKPNTKNPFSKK